MPLYEYECARGHRFETVDEFGMQAAGPGPGAPEFLKRFLVNTDNHQFRGRRRLRPEAVAEVHNLIFKVLAQPEGAYDGQGSKDQQGEAEHPHPARLQKFRNRGQF